MKLDFLCLLLLFSVIFGCGKKDDERDLYNYLDGRWRLKKIICFRDTPEPVETYHISDNLNSTFHFYGREVKYKVEPNCIIQVRGQYNLSHETFSSGKVSLINLYGGNTCNINLTEANGAGNPAVDFNVTSSHSFNLLWSYSSDDRQLTMSLASSFTGSTNLAFCNSKCKCSGVYDED